MKLYPSSAAFLKGRLCVTERKSGCLRKTLLEQSGIREPFIANESMELGTKFEEKVAAEPGHVKATRELPIQDAVAGGHLLSGRGDLVSETRHVTELKATRSSKLGAQLREGRPVAEHVAQLVSYMLATETDAGTLRYAYYNKAADKVLYARSFEITIDELGFVLKDGDYYGYTVYDVLDHQQAQIAVVENGTVADRPVNFDSRFASPCTYCPFVSVCDEWDVGALADVSSFKKRCLTAIENYVRK